MTEADEILIQEQGVGLDLLRLRGFPFGDEVEAFIAEHDKVFVVEQNRDAQMRSLLINELEIDPKKLVKILHYDGTPITARFIAEAIGEKLEQAAPLLKVVS
jgi:2-oxoglutarate ferredoxin oxidoreductase subunit alpha